LAVLEKGPMTVTAAFPEMETWALSAAMAARLGMTLPAAAPAGTAAL
jgi:hypothetical protein